ncbi:MAG: hypothetical protein IAI50_16535 [Candidatus Eremiobacteraeota bacterium]|nr:hypothetical protein [Candidatus Eremiobacteraeota bacterium]
MPVDRTALTALAEEIGRFYIRDRAMVRAQRTIVEVLARDGPPGDAAVRAYLTSVGRYFGGFEREAQTHLRDLDRRLAKASQLQFNLTAERGVAAERVERTQGVLRRVAELATR